MFRIHKLYHFDFASGYQNGRHSRQCLSLILNQPLSSRDPEVSLVGATRPLLGPTIKPPLTIQV